MKKIIPLFFFLHCVCAGSAQDTIIRANNKELILCRITKVTSLTVFYTENKIGKSISKSEVSYFSNHEAKSVPEKSITAQSTDAQKFDYLLVLNKELSLKPLMKYQFTIVDVLDARMSKTKPIGSIPDFYYKPQWVGNDSLAGNMLSFFKSNASLFDSSNKIILVINQVNIIYQGGFSMGAGKIQDNKLSVSIDYYRVSGNTCELMYQQYFRHVESMRNFISRRKGLDFTFFETIRLALEDFSEQLRFNRPLSSPVSIEALKDYASASPKQTVTNQNIRDGLYFSCKDLFQNKSGVLKEYTFSETLRNDLHLFDIKEPNYILRLPNFVVRSKRIYMQVDNGAFQEATLADDGSLMLLENGHPARRVDYETGNILPE